MKGQTLSADRRGEVTRSPDLKQSGLPVQIAAAARSNATRLRPPGDLNPGILQSARLSEHNSPSPLHATSAPFYLNNAAWRARLPSYAMCHAFGTISVNQCELDAANRLPCSNSFRS